MCIRSHSESGQPCGFAPCEKYRELEQSAALYREGTMAFNRITQAQASDISRLEAENAALRQERDRLAGIVEKADALAETVKFIPEFMSIVSNTVQYVWQRYGVKDVGFPFNPDEVADIVEVAAKAYQEAHHG